MTIKVSHISKSFQENQALREVSFSIDKGEIFGFIGPDGAGKTTLFRILVTLMLADTGGAEIAGLDVRADYRKIRKIIGYMAGRFSLYMDLTVKENLKFYATVFGATIEQNYSLIKDVYDQIKPFENRLAGRLSGGMKQKLALCCALIHKPEVLVLDEPTTGVDAVSRKEFWDMLHRIRKNGITVLVSTPYMDEAEQCDRVGLMQKGNLMYVGKPNDLRFTDHTKLFVYSSTGNAYEQLNKIRGISENISAYLFGNEIHIFTSSDVAREALKGFMIKQDQKGGEFYETIPGIEDYFMHLLNDKNE